MFGCVYQFVISSVNPFTPGNFAEKRVWKLVERFTGHCRAIIKELKLSIKPLTVRTLRPSDPESKILDLQVTRAS